MYAWSKPRLGSAIKAWLTNEKVDHSSFFFNSMNDAAIMATVAILETNLIEI